MWRIEFTYPDKPDHWMEVHKGEGASYPHNEVRKVLRMYRRTATEPGYRFRAVKRTRIEYTRVQIFK